MTLQALSVHDAAGFRRGQSRLEGRWLELKSEEGPGDLYLQPGNQCLIDVSEVGWVGVTTFGFTEKGTIVAGASDGTLQVAARRAGGYKPPERYLVGHTASVRDHAASGRWLVTCGADQIIRLWYMEDVEQDSTADLVPALNLFVGSDDEWVIWSKSGYYNASERGDRRFGYHVNRGPDKEAVLFSSDRFIKTFSTNREVIWAILQYGSEEAVSENWPELGVKGGSSRYRKDASPNHRVGGRRGEDS